MGRLGYAIFAAVVVALAVFVFRPEPRTVERGVAVYTGPAPVAYRVRIPGLEQQIDDLDVVIHGVRLPLDPERHRALWTFIGSLSTAPDKVIADVDEAKLIDYGIDGTREIVGGAVRLRWGGSGAQGYLWEGGSRRAFVADRLILQHCDELAGRFDRQQLIDLDAMRRLSVDKLGLQLVGGEWWDPQHADRPPFSRRVQRLFTLIEALRINDFTIKPPTLAPVLGVLSLGAAETITPDTAVQVWNGDAGTVLVQLAAWPVQRLTGVEAQNWRACLADFPHDYLFNLERTFALKPLAEVLVTRAGADVFRLEKNGLQDEQYGRSQWDVVWPGGREAASGESAALIADLFDRLTVRDPHLRAATEAPSPNATVIELIFQIDRERIRIAIDGDQVWSATHRATAVALPPLLQHLGPDAMLDPGLTNRDPERVVKIQRRFHDENGEHGEVFAALAGGVRGGWRQSWPETARERQVNPLALERLARALCAARGRSVRLATAVDRSLMERPSFALDLRFAPKTVRHSDDHTRLDDTTDQDLGFVFVREGEIWRAIERDGGVSYEVDAELVELLRQPVFDDLVLPLVPSLVRGLEISAPGQHYRIDISAHGWTAKQVDAAGRPAKDDKGAVVDEVQVRRFLRLLSSLRAAHVDAKAGPFLPDELAGSVVCSFPGVDGAGLNLVLNIGKPQGGEVALHAEGGRAVAGAPTGRAYLPAGEAVALLPPLSSFGGDAK